MLTTPRLRLRRMTIDDAAFMLDLLNQPSFLRHIGDREARDLAGATAYIVDRVLAAYAKHPFGMYVVELLADAQPVGICGLVKRDSLADVDIGYALLDRHAGQGYARESAEAVLRHARDDLGLPRVVAITGVDNPASIALLERVGMRFVEVLDLPEGESAFFTTDAA